MRDALSAILVLACSTSSFAADLRMPVEGSDDALYQKVITTGPSSIYDEPGGMGQKTAVAPFEIFYRITSDDGQKEVLINGKKWIRLGYGANKPAGWIETVTTIKNPSSGDDFEISKVIPWNTRALLYTRAEMIRKGNPFRLYRTANQRKLLAETRQLSARHISICPILSPPAESGEPVFHVAFFAGKATQSSRIVSPSPPLPLRDVAEEIVFVIDTTSSMARLLEAAKAITRRVIERSSKYHKLKGRLRFGLVAYQDKTPGLFASRVTIPLTSDLKAYQKAFAAVEVTVAGTEETKEDLLAGLHTAIKDAKMGWQANSLKHIILIGDASAHLEGPKHTTGLTIKEVIALARSVGGGSETSRLLGTKMLHAIRGINPGDPSDHLECKQHFQQIARNNDQEMGFYDDVDPTDEEDVRRTVDALVKIIDESLQFLNDSSSHSPNRPPSKTSDVSGSVAKAAWKLHDLASVEEVQAVIEGYTDGRDERGRMVAEPRILVQFDELERAAESLKFVYNAFDKLRNDPEGRIDVQNLLNALQVISASLIAGDYVQSTKLKSVISVLPLKSDILTMTPDDIAIMDNDGFAQFLKSIDASHRRAKALLDRTYDWHVLIGKDDQDTKNRFTFLRVDELP